MEDSKQQQLIQSWVENTSFINWAKTDNTTDVEKWNTYFQKHPEQSELGEIAKHIIIGFPVSKTEIPEQQINQSWKNILSKAEQITDKRQNNSAKERRINRIGWSIAASIIFIIGLSGWFLYTANQNTTVRILTKAGETTTVKLSDGSKVVLNANSTLTYFKGKPRSIQLTGEAFFDVAKSKTQKFEVHTNELTVEVLGTQFNVDANTENTNVYLKEGKVILNIDGTEEAIEMKPGELVTYDNQKQISKVNARAKEAIEIGWITGSLIFKNEKLDQVLSELERVYSIQLEVTDETIKEKIVTTGLPINDLPLALQVLETTLSLDFEEINQQQYKVKSQE